MLPRGQHYLTKGIKPRLQNQSPGWILGQHRMVRKLVIFQMLGDFRATFLIETTLMWFET